MLWSNAGCTGGCLCPAQATVLTRRAVVLGVQETCRCGGCIHICEPHAIQCQRGFRCVPKGPSELRGHTVLQLLSSSTACQHSTRAPGNIIIRHSDEQQSRRHVSPPAGDKIVVLTCLLVTPTVTASSPIQDNDRMQLQQAGCAAVFEPAGSLYHQGKCGLISYLAPLPMQDSVTRHMDPQDTCAWARHTGGQPVLVVMAWLPSCNPLPLLRSLICSSGAV